MDTTKRPMKQTWYIQALLRLLAKILLSGKKLEIVKIDMDGIKDEPYLLLCNHQQFQDFPVAVKVLERRKFNNVVAIDAFDIKRFGLYPGGCVPKRKFINDVSTVRNIMHSLKKNKSIMSLYPEARYTQLGTAAVLPSSLGKLIKKLKMPVAMLIINGNHLMCPTWSDFVVRKEVPLKATLKRVFTPEQLAVMTVDEINAKIRQEFEYDEYKYWQEAGFKITYPNRAQGLHNVLYKCPKCKTEYKITSSGAELQCEKCESVWELTENGFIKCKTGETKFAHVPDWAEWQRAEVRKEILAGTYEINERFEAVSQPHSKYVIPLGKANLKHNSDGFNITGHYNHEDFNIVKLPLENYSVQTEFHFPRMKKRHTFAISTNDDTFYFFPTVDGMMQKLYFAVEELYKIKKAEKAAA